MKFEHDLHNRPQAFMGTAQELDAWLFSTADLSREEEVPGVSARIRQVRTCQYLQNAFPDALDDTTRIAAILADWVCARSNPEPVFNQNNVPSKIRQRCERVRELVTSDLRDWPFAKAVQKADAPVFKVFVAYMAARLDPERIEARDVHGCNTRWVEDAYRRFDAGMDYLNKLGVNVGPMNDLESFIAQVRRPGEVTLSLGHVAGLEKRVTAGDIGPDTRLRKDHAIDTAARVTLANNMPESLMCLLSSDTAASLTPKPGDHAEDTLTEVTVTAAFRRTCYSSLDVLFQSGFPADMTLQNDRKTAEWPIKPLDMALDNPPEVATGRITEAREQAWQGLCVTLLQNGANMDDRFLRYARKQAPERLEKLQRLYETCARADLDQDLTPRDVDLRPGANAF